jgi:hypothetical protein
MPLEYRFLAVQRMREGTGDQPRFLGTQPHAAAQVGLLVAHLLAALQILPFGDQRDHRMVGGAIELGAVRALQRQHIARVFDDGELHPEANAEVWDAVFACEPDRLDLALDAAVAEAPGHQDGVHVLQRRRTQPLDVLGFEIVDVDARPGLDACVHQRLVQ